jgi:broad specificity phosphatase PhoE
MYGQLVSLTVATHEQNVKKFKLAWRAFDEAWKLGGNLDYRFGEPVREDSRYQSLEDFIQPPYGESQRQIYLRIYGRLLEIMKNAKESARLPVIVTHKTVAREIQTFIAAQNEGIPVEEYPLAKPLVHAEASYTKVLDTNLCIKSLAMSIERLTGAK